MVAGWGGEFVIFIICVYRCRRRIVRRRARVARLMSMVCLVGVWFLGVSWFIFGASMFSVFFERGSTNM